MRPAIQSDLGALDRRFRPALMAFFMRRAASHADAEDMTQELFAKLATIHQEIEGKPDAYIFQMAANLLRDRGRREQVRNQHRNETERLSSDLEPLDPARVLLGRETLG